MLFRKSIFLYVLAAGLAVSAYASPSARISAYSGSVMFQRHGETEWVSVGADEILYEGDNIRTGEASQAEIRFYAGHTAFLSESSSIKIEASADEETLLELLNGRLRSKVGPLGQGNMFEVGTPQAVCAVRGTDFTVYTDANSSRVEVHSGLVEVRELVTGMMQQVQAGYFSEVRPGQSPTLPDQIPGAEALPDDAGRGGIPVRELRAAARREMFSEISRDSVLSRAAEEIKRAEYENRKAIIDAHGNRVRMEEYIVRPSDRDFKYVVLNHREGRFDFGKINFFFDSPLPEDLSQAAGRMFKSPTEPEWVLTDLVSVISNTRDRVNEEASGGGMLSDASGVWRHYFGEYNFYVKGEGRDELRLWSAQTSLSGGTGYDSLSSRFSYLGDNNTYYSAGQSPNKPLNERSYPTGDNYFHLRLKNTYTGDVWISADDYLIDDKGDIQSTRDFEDNFNFGASGGFLRDYLAGLNVQRKYESSEFDGRDIDLVISTKLLLDAGMLDWSAD